MSTPSVITTPGHSRMQTRSGRLGSHLESQKSTFRANFEGLEAARIISAEFVVRPCRSACAAWGSLTEGLGSLDGNGAAS